MTVAVCFELLRYSLLMFIVFFVQSEKCALYSVDI